MGLLEIETFCYDYLVFQVIKGRKYVLYDKCIHKNKDLLIIKNNAANSTKT